MILNFNIVNYCTKFILIFNQPLFYAGILIYLLIKQKFFEFNKTLHLISISTCVNVALKVFFQVPLLPHLGKGYGLPSGHMQAAVVFYGILLLCIHQKPKTFAICILGIGFSIIFKNYHTIYDVLAACFVGGMIVSTHQFFNSFTIKKLIVTITITALCCIYVLIKYPPYHYIIFHFILAMISGYFLRNLCFKNKDI